MSFSEAGLLDSLLRMEERRRVSHYGYYYYPYKCRTNREIEINRGD